MVRMAVPWSCWLAKDWLIAAANDGIEVIPLNFFLEKYLSYEILDTEYCNQNKIPLNFLLEKNVWNNILDTEYYKQNTIPLNFFLEKISRPKLPARKEYSTNAGPSEHDRHTNLLGSSFKRIMMMMVMIRMVIMVMTRMLMMVTIRIIIMVMIIIITAG